jgi:predicted methyltransferase
VEATQSAHLGPYLLGPNDENQGIYTGDARELARAIPDESVDLIFTDPVYQNLDDYRWLAETAARVLKPDSACLVFCGIGWLGETIAAL